MMRGSVDDVRTPERWEEIPVRANALRRRRRHQRWAVGGVAAAAAAVVVGLVVAPGPGGGQHVVTVNPTITAVPSVPTSAATPSTGTPLTAPQAGRPTSALPQGYLPLFPYASGSEVAAAESSGRVAAWHDDPGATAVAFAKYLGYADLSHVFSVRTATDGAHVSVGYSLSGGPSGVAAVVHLVRYGSGRTAPWEVVGTDDTAFTLSTPTYGMRVSGAFTVGGTITGVDESITVKVFRSGSGDPSVDSCCHPAGGQASPWRVPVTGRAPTGAVLIVAASTGGHVATVERFAVTGLRS
jgi:hypothetical protein